MHIRGHCPEPATCMGCLGSVAAAAGGLRVLVPLPMATPRPLATCLPSFGGYDLPRFIHLSRPRARSARFVESLLGHACLSPHTPLCSVPQALLRPTSKWPSVVTSFASSSGERIGSGRARRGWMLVDLVTSSEGVSSQASRRWLLARRGCGPSNAAGPQMLMSKLSLGCQRSGGGSEPLESDTRPSLANMMCAELSPST